MIGKIYKLVHTQSDIVYVGCTTLELRNRFMKHKNEFKTRFKNDKKYNISIYKYFEQYGIDQFKMILIKEYDVIDKNHLKVYETLWINKMRCVNKQVSFNPISRKIYREINKSAIAEGNKKHYEANKDKILEKNKIYREVNKDQITIKDKIYREKNSEIIKCGCGAEIKKYKLSNHLKTKHHLNFLNKDIEVDIPTNKFKCDCGAISLKVAKARHFKSQKHINFISTQNS